MSLYNQMKDALEQKMPNREELMAPFKGMGANEIARITFLISALGAGTAQVMGEVDTTLNLLYTGGTSLLTLGALRADGQIQSWKEKRNDKRERNRRDADLSKFFELMGSPLGKYLEREDIVIYLRKVIYKSDLPESTKEVVRIKIAKVQQEMEQIGPHIKGTKKQIEEARLFRRTMIQQISSLPSEEKKEIKGKLKTL